MVQCSDLPPLMLVLYVAKHYVLGLLLSCRYGLEHKPFLVIFCVFILWTPGISEKVVFISQFAAASSIRFMLSWAVIFWEVGGVGDSDRNIRNSWKCSWKWSCVLYTCLWMVYKMQGHLLRPWRYPKSG